VTGDRWRIAIEVDCPTEVDPQTLGAHIGKTIHDHGAAVVSLFGQAVDPGPDESEYVPDVDWLNRARTFGRYTLGVLLGLVALAAILSVGDWSAHNPWRAKLVFYIVVATQVVFLAAITLLIRRVVRRDLAKLDAHRRDIDQL
jgi:hypothetical protein